MTLFLPDVPRRQWRDPSHAVPRDQIGNPIVRTMFRIRARANDGAAIWCGWFDDRDDADAFLQAIVIGTLRRERALWDLPAPMWPGLDPALVYDFATVTFLTSTTATTWTVPSDWNNANNKAEGVGAGGNTTTAAGVLSSGGGGGGGAYASVSNIFLTPSSVVNYRCGVNGGGTGAGTTNTANSYFVDGSTLVAAGGASGITTIAAYGGNAGDSTGATKYSGGNGGAGGQLITGGGGGGAAGPNGVGVNGTSAMSTAGVPGGAGNNGQAGGGAAGGAGQDGGNGTYWQASPAYGPGGGAGSNTLSGGSANGRPGGTYGGGSSGTYQIAGNIGGVGKQGLLIITYTPSPKTAFNMPLLGM